MSDDEIEAKYLYDRRGDIRLRALMNRMYYQERQKKFEFRDGIVKAVSILAGSVAFANVADKEIIQYCAALITASGAASLVFGFGTKARDSVRRHTEWAMLERDIELAGEREFFLETAKIHTEGRTLRRPNLRLLSGGLPPQQAGALGRSFG